MTSLTASEFLRLVWPKKLLTNETLELRLRRRLTEEMHREFFTSIPQLLEKASKCRSSYDCYFALGTRFGNTGGKKRDVYRIATAWCDIDNRKIEECDFSPQPNLLVNSGGGVHSYWLLKTPLLIRGEGERWEDIEAVNRALAHKFKGDTNTIDITRVLRVPGTLNHKFSPAREVKAYRV